MEVMPCARAQATIWRPVGPSLTLADIFLGAFLDPFARTPEGNRTLPKFAKIERWWNGIQGRPGLQATALAV